MLLANGHTLELHRSGEQVVLGGPWVGYERDLFGDFKVHQLTLAGGLTALGDFGDHLGVDAQLLDALATETELIAQGFELGMHRAH